LSGTKDNTLVVVGGGGLQYSWGRLDDYRIVIRRRVNLTSVGYVETFLVETIPSAFGVRELCGILWRFSFG